MIKILEDLCIGCGLCIESCPRQAISLIGGVAKIDQRLCKHCCLCLGVCPRDAIIEEKTITKSELALEIGSLKKKADNLVDRIEKIRQRRST